MEISICAVCMCCDCRNTECKEGCESHKGICDEFVRTCADYVEPDEYVESDEEQEG